MVYGLVLFHSGHFLENLCIIVYLQQRQNESFYASICAFTMIM